MNCSGFCSDAEDRCSGYFCSCFFFRIKLGKSYLIISPDLDSWMISAGIESKYPKRAPFSMTFFCLRNVLMTFSKRFSSKEVNAYIFIDKHKGSSRICGVFSYVWHLFAGKMRSDDLSRPFLFQKGLISQKISFKPCHSMRIWQAVVEPIQCISKNTVCPDLDRCFICQLDPRWVNGRADVPIY